jgi:hypothetical protein
MRKTEIRIDAFQGLVNVKCKAAGRVTGEFRCFTVDGAALVAHTFEKVSTDAARAVYTTIYAAELAKIDDETDLGDLGEAARAEMQLQRAAG